MLFRNAQIRWKDKRIFVAGKYYLAVIFDDTNGKTRRKCRNRQFIKRNH